MDRLRKCRLCDEDVQTREAIKYGTRHYAHFACYDRYKADDVNLLPQHQRERLIVWRAYNNPAREVR